MQMDEYESFLKSPVYRARKALEDLRHQAMGLEWRPVWGRPGQKEPIERNDSAAIEYAQLVCEHVEYLNQLIKTHREKLLPVSRKRFTWPILRSEHPQLCQDEKQILKELQVGKETGRFFDQSSKWKSNGKIAYLVDELLRWVDACQNPPTSYILRRRKRPMNSLRSVRRANLASAFATGIDTLYAYGCGHPLLAFLKNHLKPREQAALALAPLSEDTYEKWDAFFVGLLKDCFEDQDCAYCLAQLATESRNTPGLAKEYVIRKVRERLRSFAGLKR